MRFSKCIALLFFVCSLASALYAEVTPVRMMIGTSEMPLAPSPVYDGTHVFAPLTVLERLGATAATANGSVTITAASGQSGTVKTVDVDGKPMLPMDKVLALVGGEESYDANTRTLTLLAHLDSVEFDNDTLKINCSFPVRATARPYGGKLMVDVVGTKVASEAKEVYIGAPAVERARLGQYNGTTARVVLDLTKQTGYELETTDAATQIQVRIADGLTPITATTNDSAAPAFVPSVTIGGVLIEKVDDRSFDVVISTSGKAYASKDYSVTPPRIVLGISKAQLGQSCTITGSHSLVKPDLTKTPTGVKLTLELAKPLDYSVETTETAITVRVRPLQKSGGTLAGKVVVIDPGHGGNQKGACCGGVMEKTINMAMAKDLAAELQKQGARIIFTHDDDVMMEQSARARVAIDRSADFFIALHCNSSVVPGSATGIETYYHMQEPSPKTLASLIHDGVCKTTGMCDRRARSDGSLYGIGLGVLRTLSGSGIPGILLECGYINTAADRTKLQSTAYRTKVADGIVAGFNAYIQGTTVE